MVLVVVVAAACGDGGGERRSVAAEPSDVYCKDKNDLKYYTYAYHFYCPNCTLLITLFKYDFLFIRFR